MAAARIALTPTGPGPQPGPVATAPAPMEAAGGLSTFEALLTDQQQRPPDGQDPTHVEADAPVATSPDLSPGMARAAQAAWLPTDRFAPGVTHAARRGSIHGRGVTDDDADAARKAPAADDRAPYDIGMLLVPVAGPPVAQPPPPTALPVLSTFDLPPLLSAAVPAGRWRDVQVPDGIVRPLPAADAGSDAAALFEAGPGVAPPTAPGDGAAPEAGPVAEAPAVPPAGFSPAAIDAPAARLISGPGPGVPAPEFAHEKGTRNLAGTTSPPDAGQYTSLPGSGLRATPRDSRSNPSIDMPRIAQDDTRDPATVTPAAIASMARPTHDAASPSREPDARGAEHERAGGLERAQAATDQRPATVQTLLATGPRSRAALVSQAPGAPATLPDDASLASQMVQRMRLQWTAGAGTAVVTLDPEYLGAVTINLHVDSAGATTATLSAENADVRAWMQAHEPLLRQQLAEQGLSLDRLQVSDEHRREDDGPADERRRRWQPPAPPPPKRTATGTFAVMV